MIRLTCARAARDRAASIANGARPCSARRRFTSCSNVCSADDAPFWAKAAAINIISPTSVTPIRCILVLPPTPPLSNPQIETQPSQGRLHLVTSSDFPDEWRGLSPLFEEGQDLFGVAFGFYLFEGVDEALVGADEVGGSLYALYEFAVHIFWLDEVVAVDEDHVGVGQEVIG